VQKGNGEIRVKTKCATCFFFGEGNHHPRGEQIGKSLVRTDEVKKRIRRGKRCEGGTPGLFLVGKPGVGEEIKTDKNNGTKLVAINSFSKGGYSKKENIKGRV